MKVLVTGSCGFIGYNLCKRLVALGYQVIGVDNMNSFIYPAEFKQRNLAHLQTDSNYIGFDYDLLSDVQIIRMVVPDVVVHLAAHANVRKSQQDPLAYIDNNVKLTTKLITEILGMKEESRPLFIYASSSSVYGTNTKVPFSETDPTDNIISMYAQSKKMCESIAEMYARSSGLNAVGLRFFTVYGPGGRPDMGIYNFLTKIMDGDEVTVYGDGTMERDFTYVDDIVSGIVSCLGLKSCDHRIYNIGNNNPVQLKELINVCEQVVQRKANIKYAPVPPGDVFRTFADVKKAQKDLGYTPQVTLQEGITKTYEWIKDMRISNAICTK
jgi:UDP-glucuronate 4-epimerase